MALLEVGSNGLNNSGDAELLKNFRVLYEGEGEVPLPVIRAVRKLITADELETLVAFDERAMYEGSNVSPDLLPPKLTVEGLQSALRRGDWLQRLEIDSAWAGYAWFQYREADIYLQSIAVEPEHRGQGIAPYFLHLLDREADSRGHQRTTLSVAPNNTSGLRTFLKHGYQVTGLEKGYFEPNIDRLIMTKNQTGALSPLSRRSRTVNCDDLSGVEEVLSRGFIGTGLQILTTRNGSQASIFFQRTKAALSGHRMPV